MTVVLVLENIVVSKTVDVEEEGDESTDETLPSSTAVLVKTVVV